MKKTKSIYWISTVLFAGFMAFTAVPDVIQETEAVKFITGLGYPAYIIPFLGVAKILGSIAILIPTLKRIKEWAYAGLIIDLVGAFYSNAIVHGLNPFLVVFMLLIIAVGAVSYIFWHKTKEPVQ